MQVILQTKLIQAFKNDVFHTDHLTQVNPSVACDLLRTSTEVIETCEYSIKQSSILEGDINRSDVLSDGLGNSMQLLDVPEETFDSHSLYTSAKCGYLRIVLDPSEDLLRAYSTQVDVEGVLPPLPGMQWGIVQQDLIFFANGPAQYARSLFETNFPNSRPAHIYPPRAVQRAFIQKVIRCPLQVQPRFGTIEKFSSPLLPYAFLQTPAENAHYKKPVLFAASSEEDLQSWKVAFERKQGVQPSVLQKYCITRNRSIEERQEGQWVSTDDKQEQWILEHAQKTKLHAITHKPKMMYASSVLYTYQFYKALDNVLRKLGVHLSNQTNACEPIINALQLKTVEQHKEQKRRVINQLRKYTEPITQHASGDIQGVSMQEVQKHIFVGGPEDKVTRVELLKIFVHEALENIYLSLEQYRCRMFSLSMQYQHCLHNERQPALVYLANVRTPTKDEELLELLRNGGKLPSLADLMAAMRQFYARDGDNSGQPPLPSLQPMFNHSFEHSTPAPEQMEQFFFDMLSRHQVRCQRQLQEISAAAKERLTDPKHVIHTLCGSMATQEQTIPLFIPVIEEEGNYALPASYADIDPSVSSFWTTLANLIENHTPSAFQQSRAVQDCSRSILHILAFLKQDSTPLPSDALPIHTSTLNEEWIEQLRQILFPNILFILHTDIAKWHAPILKLMVHVMNLLVYAVYLYIMLHHITSNVDTQTQVQIRSIDKHLK